MLFDIYWRETLIESWVTCYFEPRIPGVPERKGKYYSFSFTFVLGDDIFFTDTIDWPVPLCMNPEKAKVMIDSYFDTGDYVWGYCWNWYLEGHDLMEVPEEDEYMGFANYCEWLCFNCKCAEEDYRLLDLEIYHTVGPIHLEPDNLEADPYLYHHLFPNRKYGFPAIFERDGIRNKGV